jgi:hypothetical protein
MVGYVGCQGLVGVLLFLLSDSFSFFFLAAFFFVKTREMLRKIARRFQISF